MCYQNSYLIDPFNNDTLGQSAVCLPTDNQILPRQLNQVVPFDGLCYLPLAATSRTYEGTTLSYWHVRAASWNLVVHFLAFQGLSQPNIRTL